MERRGLKVSLTYEKGFEAKKICEKTYPNLGPLLPRRLRNQIPPPSFFII